MTNQINSSPYYFKEEDRFSVKFLFLHKKALKKNLKKPPPPKKKYKKTQNKTKPRTKTKQTDAKEEKQLKDFTKCFADHFNLCIKGLRKRHIKYWDNIQDDRV